MHFLIRSKRNDLDSKILADISIRLAKRIKLNGANLYNFWRYHYAISVAEVQFALLWNVALKHREIMIARRKLSGSKACTSCLPALCAHSCECSDEMKIDYRAAQLRKMLAKDMENAQQGQSANLIEALDKNSSKSMRKTRVAQVNRVNSSCDMSFNFNCSLWELGGFSKFVTNGCAHPISMWKSVTRPVI